MIPREELAGRLPGTEHARDAWQQSVARATEFAGLVGVEIAEWMIWGGWCLHVGCDVCAEQGPDAACWGEKACHGFTEGCGCRECTERQVREINEAEAKP